MWFYLSQTHNSEILKPLFDDMNFRNGLLGPSGRPKSRFGRPVKRSVEHDFARVDFSLFLFAFSRNAFLPGKYVGWRRRGGPKSRFRFLLCGLEGVSGRPKGRNRRSQGPPKISKRGQMGHRGPRRPLREHLGSPKGHFGDCRFSSRKTYIGPQGPPKVTSCLFLCVVLGG